MRASLDKQPFDVAAMFDSVAGRYDLLNDLLSLGQDRIWRRATRTAVSARPGDRVLDLAGGTGTSANTFAADGADVVVADFSLGMLVEGTRRYPHLAFVGADATNLPFADGAFDVVTISYGLRNVVDPHAALTEMLRVTKPGGRIVVAEFSTPTWAPFRALYRWYSRRVLPWVARRLANDPEAYTYLYESIEAWPDQSGLARALQAAGWREVAYRNLSGGIVALHRGIRHAEF